MRSVEITLDKPRQLRFTIGALGALEEALGGMPLRDVVRQLNSVGVRALRLALWAGLRHEDRRLTPERVGELMDQHLERGGDLAGLYQVVDEALMASGVFGPPKAEDAEADPSPGATAPTT